MFKIFHNVDVIQENCKKSRDDLKKYQEFEEILKKFQKILWVL